jgi:hypothetical protein
LYLGDTASARDPDISQTYVSESACHELDKAANALALLRWPAGTRCWWASSCWSSCPSKPSLPLFDLLNDLCNTWYVQFLPFVANELSIYLEERP